MTHRTPPKPKHFDTVPEGTCRWCNKPVGLTKRGKPSKSRWHAECVTKFKTVFWPSVTRKLLWNRDKGKCASCGTICPKKGGLWHMDHIKPLIEANGNISYWEMPNLQTLCIKCHTAKTSAEATQRAADRRQKKL